MSEKVEVKNGAGIGLAGGLTLIFAAAKVFGFSNMTWFYVFLPVIIVWGIVLAILGFAGLVLFAAWLADEHTKRKSVKRRSEMNKRRREGLGGN